MKLLLVIAALCGASMSGQAQDISFKGVPLGSPKSVLLERFPSLQCMRPLKSAAILGEEYCESDVFKSKLDGPGSPLSSYGGQVTTGTMFGIVGGRVESFSMQFDPDKYEAIRASIQEGFGHGSESRRQLQTMGGVQLQSRTLEVSRPGGTIRLLEHAGSISTGAVAGHSSAFEAYTSRVQQGDPKAGSKDL